MEILIIIALIVAGLLLFAVEVFLVPGITLAGIASGISLLYAIYYAFHNVDTQTGFITRNNRCYHLVHALQNRRPFVPQKDTRLQTPATERNKHSGRQHRYVTDPPYPDRKRRNKRTHCRSTVCRRIYRRTYSRTCGPHRQQHSVRSTLQPAVIFNLKYHLNYD